MYLIIGLIILFSLVAMSIICGLETAFTAVSRAKLHQLIAKGNKRAMLVQKLREQMPRLIGTLTVLETIVEVSVTTLAGVMFTNLLGEKGPLVSGILMSILIIVYGQSLPKIYAFGNPERMTIRFAKISSWIFYLFSPLARLMEHIAKVSLSALRVPVKKHDASATIEELRGIIQLHASTSQSNATHEGVMLESVLDLAEVSVDEVMTHRKYVNMINADASPTEVLEFVLSSPHTRHPVWQEDRDNIIGILHTKDLLRAFAGHQGNFDDINILQACSSPWFVPETTKLLAQLQNFKARKEHLACVVDEYGAFLGIVTLEDILEEIVGPIDDEHDITLPGIRPEGGNAYSIYGWVTLRDIEKQIGIELPDEKAATIAGLVIQETQTIPSIGQKFEVCGYKMDILKKKRNQITKIRLKSA